MRLPQVTLLAAFLTCMTKIHAGVRKSPTHIQCSLVYTDYKGTGEMLADMLSGLYLQYPQTPNECMVNCTAYQICLTFSALKASLHSGIIAAPSCPLLSLFGGVV